MFVKQSLNFLVVDDFSNMCKIIRTTLRNCGYVNVEESTNAAEGLSKLRQGRLNFAIIDVNMPGMNGIEMVKEIRRDEKICHIPVLMMSADARKELVVGALQSGAQSYMVKPFTGGMLEDKVIDILKSLNQDALRRLNVIHGQTESKEKFPFFTRLH